MGWTSVWSKNLCRLTTRGPEEQCQFLSASVLWGMPARRDPLAPDHDCHDVIQLQGYHSGPATGRPPENPSPILTPRKVAGPALTTRIEQPHVPSGERITCRYLGAFEAIAHAASQPEVGFRIGPTACLRNDVINF
jgi:hypothetical protein